MAKEMRRISIWYAERGFITKTILYSLCYYLYLICLLKNYSHSNKNSLKITKEGWLPVLDD